MFKMCCIDAENIDAEQLTNCYLVRKIPPGLGVRRNFQLSEIRLLFGVERKDPKQNVLQG